MPSPFSHTSAVRLLPLIAFCLLNAFLTGCKPDGYAELGLVGVTGKVTLDGQPLAGANVVFESPDKRTARGLTDAEGKYALMYDSETPGALPGPKVVRITIADVGVEGGGAGEGSAFTGKERLPARYNRQSKLTADVSASQKTFDFELKSAP